MPGAAITIPLEGLGRELDAVARDVSPTDYRPLLRDFGNYLSAQAKNRFVTATGPDGSAWPALHFGRARGGENVKQVNRPLRDRGLLMASMTAQEGGAAGAVYSLTDRSIEQGTNLDYARIQQEGGTIYPRSAKALSIPLSREAYRAGSARKFGRPLTLVWPKGYSHGWLTEKKGKRKQQTVLHYLLVPKVTIQARPFVGVNERDADWMAAQAGDFFAAGGG